MRAERNSYYAWKGEHDEFDSWLIAFDTNRARLLYYDNRRKTRSVFLPVLIVTALLASTMHASSTASANGAASRDRCARADSRTLAASRTWRVYEPAHSIRIYACEQRTGRTRFLEYDDPGDRVPDNFVLRRDILAYDLGGCDRHNPGQCRAAIIDVNLRSRTRRAEEIDGSVLRLRLASQRRYAALVERNTRGLYAIYVRDRRGFRLLDEGPDIDPRSLSLRDGIVRWRRAGQDRSTRLD